MQIDGALVAPLLTLVLAIIGAFWRSEMRASSLERRIDAEALANSRTYATKDGIVAAVNNFTDAVNGLRSDVQGNISALRIDMRDDRKSLAERLERIENRVYPTRD